MFLEGAVRCLHLCCQLNLTLEYTFLKSVIASIEFIYSMFYIFLHKNIPTLRGVVSRIISTNATLNFQAMSFGLLYFA